MTHSENNFPELKISHEEKCEQSENGKVQKNM